MKTSVYVATSLDGFIAREDGGLDWLPGSDQVEAGEGESGEDYGFQEFIASVDVVIMGRKTYEVVLSKGLWPYADKRVVVLSSKLTQVADHLPQTVEVQSGSPTELVEGLRQSGARHIYVDGGETIRGFLNAGLVDEINLTRIPVLIGRGIPLFGPLAGDLKLRHIETRPFASGFVQSKYQVRS